MQRMPLYPTLWQALFPKRPRRRDLVLGMLGAGLLGMMAQISISLPFTPVPITGQTLGVMWVGATLGARLGFLTVLVYLGLGLGGLPVFSAGEAGLDQILGPTGGYLLAFPLAAAMIGSWVERFGVDRHPAKLFPSLLVCSLVIFVTGATWLGVWQQEAGRFEGIGVVLQAGVIPFLPGDLIKSGLTTLVLPLCWRGIKARGSAEEHGRG